jgi:hypothetical protein
MIVLGCKIYIEALLRKQEFINITAFLQRYPDIQAKMQLTD